MIAAGCCERLDLACEALVLQLRAGVRDADTDPAGGVRIVWENEEETESHCDKKEKFRCCFNIENNRSQS